MRTAWNIVSFLAVVNLLAILMCAGWLWMNGRLDHRRIATIRNTLATTVAEASTQGKANQQTIAAEFQSRHDQPRRDDWPLAGSELISRHARFDDHAALLLGRLDDENRKLTAALEARERSIIEREQALESRQQQWLKSIEDDVARRADEQFNKAVRILEGLPPRQGRAAIQALIQTGRTEQAVGYLNAMNARSAAKIVREFTADADVAVATELLEKLRTFGLVAGLEPKLRDADAAAQPVEPSA